MRLLIIKYLRTNVKNEAIILALNRLILVTTSCQELNYEKDNKFSMVFLKKFFYKK